MKIYIIRHGQTAWNVEKRLQGRSDIPLNEYGVQLAKVTASAFRGISFDRIYTSPLLRARQTAEIIAKSKGLPVLADDRLIEMSFGDGEGISLAEINTNPELTIYSFLHSPADYVPSVTGESFEQLYERCRDFIHNVILPAEQSCQSIAIVSHGALIRGLIHCINNRPTENFWQTIHRNCSVSLVTCEKGKLTLVEEAKTYYTENVEATW